MNDSQPTLVKSAARVTDILEFVAGALEPPRASDIAVALCLPRSSLSHLIATLITREYLAPAAGGGFVLGRAIERLSGRVPGARSVANRAQSAMSRLSDFVNETCGYYELRGLKAEVVSSRSGRQALTYLLRTGDLAPLHCVSAGKALLAAQTPNFLQRYLQETLLTAYTPSTLVDPDTIKNDLDRVRSDGFAYSREEYVVGIIGVATAVYIDGEVVGAVSVAAPSVRFNDEVNWRFRGALSRCAAEIESGSVIGE